jgi:hypothetical protein
VSWLPQTIQTTEGSTHDTHFQALAVFTAPNLLHLSKISYAGHMRMSIDIADRHPHMTGIPA